MSYKVFEFPIKYLITEHEKSYLFYDKKTNTKSWLSKKLVKNVDEDSFTLILPDTFNLKFFRSKKEEGEYVITDNFEVSSEMFVKSFKQFIKENKPFQLKKPPISKPAAAEEEEELPFVTAKKTVKKQYENPFLRD